MYRYCVLLRWRSSTGGVDCVRMKDYDSCKISFPRKMTYPSFRSKCESGRAFGGFFFVLRFMPDDAGGRSTGGSTSIAVLVGASSGTVSSPGSSIGCAGMRRDALQDMHLYITRRPWVRDAFQVNEEVNTNSDGKEAARTCLRFTRVMAVEPGISTILHPLQSVLLTEGSLNTMSNVCDTCSAKGIYYILTVVFWPMIFIDRM